MQQDEQGTECTREYLVPAQIWSVSVFIYNHVNELETVCVPLTPE